MRVKMYMATLFIQTFSSFRTLILKQRQGLAQKFNSKIKKNFSLIKKIQNLFHPSIFLNL